MLSIKIITLLGGCALCGLLGGYYGAKLAPIEAQVAIVDMEALLKKAISTNQANTAEEGKQLMEKVKKVTGPLVERGIIILDSQSVLSAPEAAYVSID